MPKLTRKTVKIAGIAGVALLAVAGGAVIGQPVLNEYSANATAVEDAEALISQMSAAKAQLEAARSIYTDVAGIDEQLLAAFPETAEIQQLLTDINTSVVQAGIPQSNLTSVTFANPTINVPEAGAVAPADSTGEEGAAAPVDPVASAGSYATLEVGGSVRGQTAQLEAVLQSLNSMQRAFIIEDFSISAEEDGVAVLSFTGTAFVYTVISSPEEIAAGVPTEGVPESTPTPEQP